MDLIKQLINILKFIKFSHTIFALPFALSAMLIAADGLPSWSIILWTIVCLVTARTAAMAYNRYADWEWDKLNPRTVERHRLVNRRFAWWLTCFSVVGFVIGTWFLNPLCFLLSPIAVALILFYSLSKHVTVFTHGFLGLALATAPMGAWAAVKATLWEWQPWVLAMAVFFWVFGFDLIYATLDSKFDQKVGLRSFPAKFGNASAFRWAKALHLIAWIIFGFFGFWNGLSWRYFVGWAGIGMVLIFEHRMVKEGNIQRINTAFFQANAIVSLLFLGSICWDIYG